MSEASSGKPRIVLFNPSPWENMPLLRASVALARRLGAPQRSRIPDQDRRSRQRRRSREASARGLSRCASLRRYLADGNDDRRGAQDVRQGPRALSGPPDRVGRHARVDRARSNMRASARRHRRRRSGRGYLHGSRRRPERSAAARRGQRNTIQTRRPCRRHRASAVDRHRHPAGDSLRARRRRAIRRAPQCRAGSPSEGPTRR